MKLQIVEFEQREEKESFEYEAGYKWSHLRDPKTGKYYRLLSGEIEVDETLLEEIDEE